MLIYICVCLGLFSTFLVGSLIGRYTVKNSLLLGIPIEGVKYLPEASMDQQENEIVPTDKGTFEEPSDAELTLRVVDNQDGTLRINIKAMPSEVNFAYLSNMRDALTFLIDRHLAKVFEVSKGIQ